jgi:hypothetical protein
LTLLQSLELLVSSIMDGIYFIKEVDISNNYKVKSYQTTNYLISLNKFTGNLDFNQLLESIMTWLL